MTDLVIAELTTDAELQAAYPLLLLLRDRLRPETFLEEIRTQEAEGYRLIGGYLDAQLVTLAGLRRQHTLARGPHAFVDDLITLPEAQGKGYATALLKHIAAQAAENGLPRVYLDARASALSFYDKLQFRFLTSIPCWISSNALAQGAVE